MSRYFSIQHSANVTLTSICAPPNSARLAIAGLRLLSVAPLGALRSWLAAQALALSRRRPPQQHPPLEVAPALVQAVRACRTLAIHAAGGAATIHEHQLCQLALCVGQAEG